MITGREQVITGRTEANTGETAFRGQTSGNHRADKQLTCRQQIYIELTINEAEVAAA